MSRSIYRGIQLRFMLEKRETTYLYPGKSMHLIKVQDSSTVECCVEVSLCIAIVVKG